MPKNSPLPLHKHTLLLFEGDYQALQELYPEVGAAVIVRNLIRAHLKKIDKPIDLSDIRVKEEI